MLCCTEVTMHCDTDITQTRLGGASFSANALKLTDFQVPQMTQFAAPAG